MPPPPPPHPRWWVPENLGGGVQPASQIPYPAITKICGIPSPIYYLAKNSKPYLWSDLYIKTLFLTSIITSSLVQTSVKLLLTYSWRAFIDFLFDNVKNIPISRLECKNHTFLWPRLPKSARIDTLFMTKTAEKPYPSRLYIPIYPI